MRSSQHKGQQCGEDFFPVLYIALMTARKGTYRLRLRRLLLPLTQREGFLDASAAAKLRARITTEPVFRDLSDVAGGLVASRERLLVGSAGRVHNVFTALCAVQQSTVVILWKVGERVEETAIGMGFAGGNTSFFG